MTNLTKDQISRFPEYVKKWTDIGLSCEPVDMPRFKAGVALAYTAAKIKPPTDIIVCDSPISLLEENSVRGSVFNSVRDNVWNSVRNSVCNSVYNSVSNSVSNSVWNSVDESVSDSVWNSVYNSVWNNVWNSVFNNVSNSVSDSVWNSVSNSVMVREMYYGSHSSGWLSSYSFMREVVNLKQQTEPLVGLMEMAQSAGWAGMYTDVVIVQHRHSELHRNLEGRLHCETGMAVKYRDGWGLWAIGGVTVDEQIVMKPETQTVEQIRVEANAEVKRIRIERFGWDRYLKEIDAKEIDARHNAIENTYEVLVKTPDGMTVLLPTCKTGRLFSLEVPTGITTCEQAQSWLHSGSKIDELIGKTRVIGRT